MVQRLVERKDLSEMVASNVQNVSKTLAERTAKNLPFGSWFLGGGNAASVASSRQPTPSVPDDD